MTVQKKPPTPIDVPPSFIRGVIATNDSDELKAAILSGSPRARRPSHRLRQKSTDLVTPREGIIVALDGESPPSSRDSSTPSPPTSGPNGRCHSINRTSSRSGSYIPRSPAATTGVNEPYRTMGTHHATTSSPNLVSHHVPFPDSSSSAVSPTRAEPRLGQMLTSTNTLVAKTSSSPPGAFDLSTPTKPSFPCARRGSDFDAPRMTNRDRPSSNPVAAAEDAVAKLERKIRHESMVNLGAAEGAGDLKRLSSGSGFSGSGLGGSGIRTTVIVKEEGKPPVNYVRISFLLRILSQVLMMRVFSATWQLYWEGTVWLCVPGAQYDNRADGRCQADQSVWTQGGRSLAAHEGGRFAQEIDASKYRQV